MENPATIPSEDAASTLAALRSTRARTRADLRSYWFALVVFGALTLLSTPFFDLWDGAGVGLFWLVAAPLGMAAMARYHRNRDDELGIAPAPRAYVITAGALVAACFGLGFGGGFSDQPDVATFGPPLAIAVAYVVFAWLERSAVLALVACVMGGLTVALAAAEVANAGQILAGAYGASFLILGLLARRWTTKPR